VLRDWRRPGWARFGHRIVWRAGADAGPYRARGNDMFLVQPHGAGHVGPVATLRWGAGGGRIPDTCSGWQL